MVHHLRHLLTECIIRNWECSCRKQMKHRTAAAAVIALKNTEILLNQNMGADHVRPGFCIQVLRAYGRVLYMLCHERKSGWTVPPCVGREAAFLWFPLYQWGKCTGKYNDTIVNTSSQKLRTLRQFSKDFLLTDVWLIYISDLKETSSSSKASMAQIEETDCGEQKTEFPVSISLRTKMLPLNKIYYYPRV